MFRAARRLVAILLACAAGLALAQPPAAKPTRILFIGKAEDSERVKTAVAPSGAEYVFVEAK